MSIEYEIIDVLRIIRKKWYIILAMTITFALSSIPLSQISYTKAEKNYKKNTMETVEPVKVNIESYIYVQANDIVQKKLYSVGRDIQRIIAKKKVAEEMQYEYYESINAIRIYVENIDIEEWNSFIIELERDINDILLKRFDNKIWIEIETIQNEDQNNNVGEIILKEPSKIILGVKSVCKAGIFGCLLGLALVLIVDYLKCCKKISLVNK